MLPWRKHPQGFWSAWFGSLLSFSPVYASQEFLFPWSGGEPPTSRSGSLTGRQLSVAGISTWKFCRQPFSLWRFACRLDIASLSHSDGLPVASISPAFLTLAVCLSPRHHWLFFLSGLPVASTSLAFLRRFVITDSFKIMNSQIENNLSYLGTSFSILMVFLFMNSQIDIYDSHMGSEQRQIHWISGAALFAAQKNSRNNIKIYDVGTPKTDIVKRL